MSKPLDQQLDELNRIGEERWERHRALLPKTDDVSLVVLKGHLIIEEMLYALLEEQCVDTESLEKARLSFAQLLHLVCAFCKFPAIEHCAPQIALLNSLRNALVHNLEPRELAPRLTALSQMCQPSDGVYPANHVAPTEPARIAEACICFIIGQLSVIALLEAVLERNPDLFSPRPGPGNNDSPF